MTRRRLQPGFTLLELVMVLVVIATVVAMVAPSLSGWGRGQRLNSAGDEFLAVARHGRAMAIANSQVYRLYVDPTAGRYWLMAQQGQEFVSLGTGMGRIFTLPQGCQIQMAESGQRTPLEFVEFYPSGRMHPLASVVVTGENGSTYAFDTPSAVEGLVAVADAQQQVVMR